MEAAAASRGAWPRAASRVALCICTHSRPQAAGHVPALDGLRAFAILAVLLCHLSIKGLANLGWAGVNLFLVLSGYLITGIPLRTKGSPNYFRRFCARRALRIFPIYYLVLTAVILLYAVQRKPLAPAVWYAAYIQNFPLGLTQESYRQIPLSERIGHSWSLAVEEQFYLLRPLAVLLSQRSASLQRQAPGTRI